MSNPPKGLLRSLLSAPRWLYRLRLGWLLGHRFLLLTHRGRISGRVFETVVEVVRYEKTGGESIVIAGRGEPTDWYQNLRAGGALQVNTAGRRYQPIVRFLEPAEAYRELQAYLQRIPWARSVTARLYGLRLDGSDSDQAQDLRGVSFEPAQKMLRPELTPAPG